MSDLLGQLRKAIEASEVSRYRISKDLGIDKGQLSRLMSGERGLSIEAAERLADYLRLEIVVRPKRRRKGG